MSVCACVCVYGSWGVRWVGVGGVGGGGSGRGESTQQMQIMV